MKKALLVVLALLLNACQQMAAPTLPPATFTPEPTATATLPPPEVTSTPLPTVTITPTPLIYEVCCPLEEETFESLPLILINPLKIPAFGQDDGHHGLDFAYFQRGERTSIQGIEIYAALPGTISLTMENNIPYGYTVIIETPLSALPESLQKTLLDGYLPIPEEVAYRGACPEISPPALTGEYSVYHLYAHMEELPEFQPGANVKCGQKLGTVGNSGRSSNPHLHFETRLGPSGADLADMAFYDTTYTEQQRAAYCLWRMSGYFQLFDPLLLFDGAE